MRVHLRGGSPKAPGRTRAAITHAHALLRADSRRIARNWRTVCRIGPRRTVRALSRSAGRSLERVWARIHPHGSRIIRLTAATVITFIIVGMVFPGRVELTGPLTALLVVQASLVQTLSHGLGRIAAVLTGVLIATILASVVGLTWWSLGIAVGFALTLGYVMNLGDHVLETPISAMLILAVSSPETAATARVAMTLIGAFVGVLFTLLLPPPVLTASVSESIRAVSDRISGALRQVCRGLARGEEPASFETWIRQVHAALPLVAHADAQITEAENRRRFNPRALGHDEPLPVLRAGLSGLDRVTLAIRQLLMSLQAHYPEPDQLTATDRELTQAFAVTLAGLADSVDAYGRSIQAEADDNPQVAGAALRESANSADETRAMLDELALAAPAASRWLLHPAVVASMEQALYELSSPRQRRRLADWQARQDGAKAFRTPHALERARVTRWRLWARTATPRSAAHHPGATQRAQSPIEPPEPPSTRADTFTETSSSDTGTGTKTDPQTLAISYRDITSARAVRPGDPNAGRRRDRQPGQGA